MAHQFIRLKRKMVMKNAPDIMRQNCLVYMEGGHNKVANQVILDNMEYIKEKIRPMEKEFDWEGPLPMKFIYLPNVATEYEDNIKYYVPTLNRYENIPQLPTNALATFLNISKIPPCFFRYECENYDEDGGEAYPVFSVICFICDDVADGKAMLDDLFAKYAVFDKEQKEEDERQKALEEQMAFACNSLENANDVTKASAIIDFDLNKYIKKDNIPITADDTFNEETKKLIKEVKDKINKLRLNGVSEWIIQQLALPQDKLSRLVITKDFRIFLPDYNNMEIKMEPIVKSVFLLFLENEEGIPFKCLSDYRERLTTIYNKVKEYTNDGTRLSADRVWQTIYNLTNPLSNSINEKCTRIKEAFLSQFDEHLANYYYITGKRGEAKKITLPRKLIEIQCEL